MCKDTGHCMFCTNHTLRCTRTKLKNNKSELKGKNNMYDYERLEQYALKISSRIGFAPKVGIVLGSGMGEIADKINAVYTFAFNDISGFPMSTVEGHAGQFVFGYIQDVPVVCMQGRIHYYEGYSMEEVVLPIRFMAIMGVEILLLTNAAGGINPDYNVGDIVLLTDHISTFVPNPLINKNIDSLGVRFPDMSHVYDEKMRDTMKEIAKQNGIEVKEGVYIQFTGPSYETPAEIRMAAALGADLVGMSTACEAIAAKHAGMKICGISHVTNAAAGLSDKELSHEEVQQAAKQCENKLETLISGFCKTLK